MTARPVHATVLVFDRDEVMLVRCARMLESAGLGVRVAGGLRAALAVIADGGVDVVLASAEASSRDALREIRARDAELPVVFVTAWPSFEDPEVANSLIGTVASAAAGRREERRARTTRPPSYSPRRGE